MGLLLAVVIQSKNLSAFGASQAMKLGGMASFGAISLAGRATLGGAGGLLASKRMQSWARTGGLSGLLLKGAVLGGKGLRGATYDVRNMPGATAGLGMLGIDAGKGATLTAKQVIEAQGGWKPTKEWLQHSKEERDQAGREMDFKDAQGVIERAQGKIKAEDAKLAAGTITPAQYAINVAPYKKTIEDGEKIIADSLSKMSTKQFEELGGIKKGIGALVQNLSPQQFEALMKSDKLNDVEKGNIKTARFAPLNSKVASANTEIIKANTDLVAGTITQAQRDAVVTRNTQDINKIVNAYSKSELESMPTNMLTNQLVVEELSPQQFETIQKSEKISKVDKGKITQVRYEAVDTAARAATAAPSPANTAALKKALNALSKNELETMSPTMLSNPEVLQNLSDKHRDTIADSKDRTKAEKQMVRESSPTGIIEGVFDAASAAAGGGPAGAAAGAAAAVAHPKFIDLTAPQLAKLDKAILKEPVIASRLTAATLKELQGLNKLSPPEMLAIGAHIRANPALDVGTRNYITVGPGASFW